MASMAIVSAEAEATGGRYEAVEAFAPRAEKPEVREQPALQAQLAPPESPPDQDHTMEEEVEEKVEAMPEAPIEKAPGKVRTARGVRDLRSKILQRGF